MQSRRNKDHRRRVRDAARIAMTPPSPDDFGVSLMEKAMRAMLRGEPLPPPPWEHGPPLPDGMHHVVLTPGPGIPACEVCGQQVHARGCPNIAF